MIKQIEEVFNILLPPKKRKKKLNKYVITYNLLKISIEEAKQLLIQIFGIAIEERLVEPTFTHLSQIGVSIIDLSGMEYNVLRELINQSSSIIGINTFKVVEITPDEPLVYDDLIEPPANQKISISPPFSFMTGIKANLAWGKRINGKKIDGTGVNILVIDTGVKASQASNFQNPLGLITGIPSTHLTTTSGHGTACAGLIAAKGGYGVAPGAKIFSYKVGRMLGGKLVATKAHLLTALDKTATYNAGKVAVDKIHVINISLALYGKPNYDFKNAALSLSDCVIVAGSGNKGEVASNGYKISRPANTPSPNVVNNVVAVGALNNDKSLWIDSCYMPHVGSSLPTNPVTVVAFGENINTIVSVNGLSGTSFACALVSGALALIMQKHGYNVSNAINKLKNTANNSLPSYTQNSDKYGSGLIDCDAATN